MDWHREMATRLSQAGNGDSKKIIEEYQALSGKSSATLYRIAAQNGYDSGRSKRKDSGTLKSGINEQQLQFISAIIQETARQVKGTILPLSEAMQIAIDNGVLREGQISEGRLQAILRERDMNSTALDSVDPSIRMASLHPNHVHVFDASICIQYYLKNGRGLGLIDERDYNEKKPANMDKIKQRLIRMILTDHFSHLIYPRYYVAAGENQRITFDFLSATWRGSHHEKLPFRGVPKFLLMDAGSANIAKGILNLIERLGIEIPKSMPHNPKRQGSAETAQQIVETHFEARLRLEPAHTIEELNAWAIDWATWWNGKRKHKRHGMTRTSCWLTITQDQLIDLPSDEILQDLFAEPEVERTVKQDLTIPFRKQDYRLKHIDGIRPGKKVKVVLRPYHWPEVAVVFNDAEYLVSPIGTIAGNFSADAAIIGQEYKAQPDTPVQTVRKSNENLAFGEERKKNAVPFGGTLRVHGHHAEKLGNMTPMSKRSTPMELTRPVGPQRISITVFFKRILEETGKPISADLNRQLRDEFGDSIEIHQADRVIAALTANEEWRLSEDQRQAL